MRRYIVLLMLVVVIVAGCTDPGNVVPPSPATAAMEPEASVTATPASTSGGAAPMVADCPPAPSGPSPEPTIPDDPAEFEGINPPDAVSNAIGALADDPVYAGTTVIRDEGPHFMRVYLTDDVDRIARQLDPVSQAAGYRIDYQVAEYSYAELEAVQEQLFADQPDLGPSALLNHTSIDVFRNRLGVGVIAVDDQARRLLAARYGTDKLCIEPVDGPPADVLPGGGAEGVVPIPTSDIVNGEQALQVGVLRSDGHSCVWQGDDAAGSDIVWPPGFGARFTDQGVELVAPDGQVVATEGDYLELGGGGRDDAGAACAPGGDGGAFVAGSVTVVPGGPPTEE